MNKTIYVVGDVKIVFSTHEMQSCVDHLFSESSDKPIRFNVMFFDITGENELMSLFPKELANIITDYNGRECAYEMEQTHFSAIYITNMDRLSYTYNILTCSAEKNLTDYVKFNQIDGNEMKNETRLCLAHVIDNNMMSLFLNMDYQKMFIACTQIAYNLNCEKYYPEFFIAMYHICRKKIFDEVIIAHCAYNMINKKMSKN